MSEEDKLDFGFNPDEKRVVLIDENCLGSDLSKPWQSALEALMKLDKAGHNLQIFTTDPAKIYKMFADNFTQKVVMETRERKVEEKEVTKKKMISGEIVEVTETVKEETFPKVTKEVDAVVIHPKIVRLPKKDTRSARAGRMLYISNGTGYGIIIVESTDDVPCMLKSTKNRVIHDIKDISDWSFETLSGSVAHIVQVKKHTDWPKVFRVDNKRATTDEVRARIEELEEQKRLAVEAAMKDTKKEG